MLKLLFIMLWNTFFYIVTNVIYKGQKFYLKSQKYGEFKM